MKNIKINLLVIFFSLTSITCIQGQKKLQTQIDFRYSLGLLEKGQIWNYNRSDANMYANTLRITELYSLSDKFNVGLGIGVDKFYKPMYNTFPLFGAVQYMPFIDKRNIPYLFSNIGYGLPVQIVNPGLMADFGIGYKLVNSKQFGLNIQFGYNYQQILAEVQIDPQPTNIVGNPFVFQNRHSLLFSLGLVF
jgi:hypothetical protein